MGLDWFFLAIGATLLWSVSAIITKFVRIKYIKSPIGYIVITSPVVFFSLIFLLFGKVHIPSAKLLVYIFVTSAAGLAGYWLYLTAMNKEDVSKVITLFGMQPLFVLLLATFFLKEVLTLDDYLAFPLIITGSMLISVKRVGEKFTLSPALGFVLASIFFFSLMNLFLKMASQVDFVSIMILRQLGFITIILPLFLFSKEVRNKTKEDMKHINKKKLGLIYAGEVIAMIGLGLSFLALQKGPLSLVTLIEGTEGLFVIILAALISIFIPKILKEEITKKTISLKIIAALFMIAGLYLIGK